MGQKCQSCDMPFSKDPEGGGSETDGSRSAKYCSICYADGTFRHPNVTVKEFQANCVDAMTANGMPRIMAWLLTRRIPKLERWAG
ncbi:MAG: zinc ribbon domain-containing protein [Boseongicola sp.]|nr:zinc ribbon domain-containing protein [Boseongicola sp.]MYH58248.1 hypothetical protein [Boseongicola sp. SB0675_bin_26]